HRWSASPRLGALISDHVSVSNIPKVETPILPHPSPQAATELPSAIASRQAPPHQLPPLKKVEIKKAEPKKPSNPTLASAPNSDSRGRSFGDRNWERINEAADRG
ncbi:Hypothetical predicted protein, partial [Olea europaea subsp. europaea]